MAEGSDNPRDLVAIVLLCNCLKRSKEILKIDNLEELKKEWIFEENIMEIRTQKKSIIRLYDEHLIEIAKTTDDNGYYVNIYKVVASGALYNNPQLALMDAIRFLNRRDKRISFDERYNKRSRK